MVWVSLIIAILNLIVKLPAIIEMLRDIFGSMKRLTPLRAAREASKLLRACESKLAQLDGQAVSEFEGVECPLASYRDQLAAKVAKIA